MSESNPLPGVPDVESPLFDRLFEAKNAGPETLDVARRLRRDGFALVAVMVAAVASGLIAPGLGKLILDADAASNASVSQAWRVAFNFNGMINQAFAKVFVVSSSTAIFVWSLAMRRQRIWASSAIYGLLLAPITIVVLLSGHLSLGVHGFGMIVLLQALWFVTVGAAMFTTISVPALLEN